MIANRIRAGKNAAVFIWLICLCVSIVTGCGPEDSGNAQGSSGKNEESGVQHVPANRAQLPPRELARPASVVESEPRSSISSVPVATQEPSNRARNVNDLISDLQKLDWNQSEEVLQRADPILQSLRSRGAGALIPIRDYLLYSDDTATSLRQALLDVLLGLASPEVEGVALELLAAGPSASEVWQLGAYLDAVQPGKYSETIRSAAELALVEAAPSVMLPPEFFMLLGEFGNVETALLLDEAPPYHLAYASLALAQLGDDDGLLILEKRARLFKSGQDTIEARLAVELLAQYAPQSAEAAAALIELGKQGVIPNEIWPHVLDLVAGNWQLSLIEPPADRLVGSHTFYRPEGNQVIYRVAPLLSAEDGLESQRLYLLEIMQAFVPAGLGLTPGG